MTSKCKYHRELHLRCLSSLKSLWTWYRFEKWWHRRNLVWEIMGSNEVFRKSKTKMLPNQESAFCSICMDDSLACSDVSIKIFKSWLGSWCFDPSQGFIRSHYSKTELTSCLKSAITHWCFATKQILSCCFRCSQQFQ